MMVKPTCIFSYWGQGGGDGVFMHSLALAFSVIQKVHESGSVAELQVRSMISQWKVDFI